MRIYYLLTALLISFAFIAKSQNISVKSFQPLQNDMDARVNYPKTDQNGEKCAIIKVVTTEQGFAWEGDALGIVATQKNIGEYWLYVPRGAKRLTVKHDKLGVLRNYNYPVPIKEATVYEMQLTTAKLTTIVEEYEVPTQWVVITSEPEGADVYINDQHKGQTPWQMEMEEGEYNYRIEKTLYHPEAGKFNLVASEGKKVNDYVLRPNFGYAKITTTPESGATVLIDGTQIAQTTPLTTQKLKSGKHTIEAIKPMFYNSSTEIEIIDGQTTDVNLELKPSFGGYTVRTIPESGATVMLDGQPTNKTTPCTLERLSSGEHTITVRKEWYQPQSKRITVVDGQSGQIEISMQPTFGTVKLITDTESDLYIDNQLKSKGSWEGKLIAGWHTFEARKDKHHSATEKQEIFINENREIQLTPQPMYGSLKIQTTPFDATIKLNGKKYGTTPNTIKDILIGDYTLTLEKQGFGTINKMINITENQTTIINENLPEGVQVYFTSDPPGADLYIDGVKKGVTPITLTLSFANHLVKVDNEGTVKERTIEISQNGKTSFSFDVNPKGTFIDKRDGQEYNWVKIGEQTWMAENLNYKTTDSYCYDNNKSNCQKYGRLYIWNAAKNACPSGWHLPSKTEFETLLNNFRGDKPSYKALIAGGSSGFSAPLGGWRWDSGGFDYQGTNAYFWSSSRTAVLPRGLYLFSIPKRANMHGYLPSVGLSVRCIKD